MDSSQQLFAFPVGGSWERASTGEVAPSATGHHIIAKERQSPENTRLTTLLDRYIGAAIRR